MSKRYGVVEHQLAFNLWLTTKNMSTVASQIGCGYQTSYDWMRDDFRCVDGCPWHGWDKLIENRQKAIEEYGVTTGEADTPETLEMAVLEVAVKHGGSDKAKQFALRTLVKNDLERIAQWELIRSSIYFQLTGLKLQVQMPFSISNLEEVKEAATIFNTKMPVKDLESGLRLLSSIEDKIDFYSRRVAPDINKQEETAPTVGQPSIDELRAARANLATKVTVIDAK